MNDMQNINNAVDLLDINVGNLLRDVQKKCTFYNVPIDLDKEKLCKCINQSMEVEVKEREVGIEQQRAVIRKKNGTGMYISVKNFRFYPSLFLEGLSVIVVGEFQPIAFMLFILNLLKQMNVDINRKELLLYSIIYTETKRRILTDDNLLERINLNMRLCGYDELGRESAYEIINSLLEIEMISVIDGSYVANEKFYFG